MRGKILKGLSLALAVLVTPLNVCQTFAYNLDESGNSIEMIEYQNTEDANFSTSTNVFAQISSMYKVTIPKTIVLNGKTKSASYIVKVEGDIAGYEKVSVIPQKTFDLFSKNKDSQKAEILQDKTTWHVSDFDTDANGTISAPTITAGKWTGTFNFDINLYDNSNPTNISKVAASIITPDGEIFETDPSDMVEPIYVLVDTKPGNCIEGEVRTYKNLTYDINPMYEEYITETDMPKYGIHNFEDIFEEEIGDSSITLISYKKCKDCNYKSDVRKYTVSTPNNEKITDYKLTKPTCTTDGSILLTYKNNDVTNYVFKDIYRLNHIYNENGYCINCKSHITSR